jgi:glycosyltransferase involved in cell wall biosynthesis
MNISNQKLNIETITPLSTQVQQLINCCQKGEFSKAKRELALLQRQVSSCSTDEVPKLISLLDYIEKKLPSCTQVTSSKTVYNHDFFKLLRNEYSKLVLPNASFTNIKKSDSVFSLKLIEGARGTVYWGQRLKQVVGRDKQGLDVAIYDKVAVARRRLDAQKKEDVTNVIYIVTPSYNSVQYIDRTILSVISQEGPFKIHYHVQDGGSSDGTVEKLEKWKSLLSSKSCDLVRCKSLSFSFCCEKDEGMYDAINKGFETLSISKDSICSWINSDDIFTAGALASAWNIFAYNNDAFWLIGATCGCDEFLSELSSLPLQFPQEVIRRGLCDGTNWRFIQQEGSFWRNSLWTELGGLESSLKYCADWDLWRRFAAVVKPIHVESPLARFRFHPGQLTSTIENYFQEMERIVSTKVRQERLESLRAFTLDSIKIVNRPNRQGVKPIYKETPLQGSCVGRVKSQRASSVIQQILRNLDQAPIKVMTLNTLALGGAGTGTLRRIEALRSIGVDARLLSLVSGLRKEYVGCFIPTFDSLKEQNKIDVWHYIRQKIQSKVMGVPGFAGHELFSLTDSVIDMRQLKPLFDEVDIVHLHWVVGMLDYQNMPEVLANKPIVWTTGDMNPFTGGCHYSQGCQGFMRECSDCPMVPFNTRLVHDAWKTKKKAYDSLDITLVCPSEYIASIARQSSLLGEKPIQVIPNAYPVDRFMPVERIKAREKLGLPQDKKLLLFGAQDLANIRKGGDLLQQIVAMLQQKSLSNEFELVFFGSGNLSLPLKINYLGSLEEHQLSDAYSAADAFVSLSREDVGPMTVVESMLCGTPVIGFSVGVLPEVVAQNSTGYCAEPFKKEAIVEGIQWAMEVARNDTDIGALCRSSAMEYGDPKVTAHRHRHLYEAKIK